MAHVLIVEDQKKLAASLRKGLEEEGFEVGTAHTGEEGFYQATTRSPDALVLDMQHGMGIGPDRAVQALQIISTTDVTPLVRVPWNDPIYIQYVLDVLEEF